MNTAAFEPLLEKLSEILKTGSNRLQLSKMVRNLDIKEDSADAFVRSLIDCASAANLTFVTQEFTRSEFVRMVRSLSFPVIVFPDSDQVVPLILHHDGKKLLAWFCYDESCEPVDDSKLEALLTSCLSYKQIQTLFKKDSPQIASDDTVFVLAPVELQSMFGDAPTNGAGHEAKVYTPLLRFWKFVTSERKNIGYIYVYALIIGIINLSLPLGIQAIIGRISGGLLFDGVVVLIVFVILGVLIAGGLQIMQIYLVEILQRRIFAKAAFEFAFRIPRIKTEALFSVHPPELMNRFFDVLTLQKSFSKILLDLTTAILQIVFGLMLLAFYHASFVFFGLFLLVVLTVIFRIIGPNALKTSLKESKYKYAMVAWFEDLASNIRTFKMAGYSTLPMDKTDEHVDTYLKARKLHFKALLSHFISITIFKLLVTGGTLIIGCVLVVNREITLGQFVASEIVIILIMSAVEKIVLNLDIIYDVLTAVEKIAQVTDLPLDKGPGISVPASSAEGGIKLKANNLEFSYPHSSRPVVKGLNLEVNPGEKVCITGLNGSGKSTLASLLSGIYSSFKGSITVNGIPIRSIRNANLHEFISGNSSQDDIFGGTIEENIRLGNKSISHEMVSHALTKAGLGDLIMQLPDGIFTPLLPGGKGLAGSVVRKMQLARVFAHSPKLLVFNDFFNHLEKEEKGRLIDSVCSVGSPQSLLAFSTDEDLMKKCDRILILSNGAIIAEGNFAEIKSHPVMKRILND